MKPKEMTLRLPDDLIAGLDAAIDGITVGSRSQAVRLAVVAWLQTRKVTK